MPHVRIDMRFEAYSTAQNPDIHLGRDSVVQNGGRSIPPVFCEGCQTQRLIRLLRLVQRR